MHERPLVVLVTGAPGAGKSTLARALAEHMRIPHIERDVVIRGIKLTRSENPEPSESIPAYYDIIDVMLDKDISLVTDGTMYKGISENDIKERLVSRAFVVNLHCRAGDEHQRFRQRELARTFYSTDWVDDHMQRLNDIYKDVVDPLDYGVECIEVNTNSGYEPTIEALAAMVMELYESELECSYETISE
jgi:broad-specificity NMP kinase